MLDAIEVALRQVAERFADRRTHLFEVKVSSLQENKLTLEGRVLQESDLQTFIGVIRLLQPELNVNTTAVTVLRKALPRIFTVAVSLTNLQREPDWLSEVVSQLLFGWQLEVLEEKGSWAFVRLMDGYLGWAYLPYLREAPAPFPTHLVLAPEMILRKRPALNGNILTRLLGGAAVQVSAMKGKWAQVVAHFTGWAPAGQLRSLAELPFTQEARQTMMMKDANSLVGVPYLWGGISSYGIDCSGLAQLLYRWIGIPVPRDADMQYKAGCKVEPPFRPGDLLFYAESGSSGKITHVSISIGGWKIIHSSRSRNGVYFDDVLKDRYLREAFIGACTFPG